MRRELSEKEILDTVRDIPGRGSGHRGVQAVPDAQGTLFGPEAWPGLVLRADA